MPEKTNPQTQKLFHYCSKLPDLAESLKVMEMRRNNLAEARKQWRSGYGEENRSH